MVRIRLRRVGSKGQASFRMVAADKESPRDGRFIENLGLYNPRTKPATIDLKEDRIYDWMSKGAQPSESALQIFQTSGLTERYERFKAGEKVETLLAEAEEATKARTTSPKTRFPAPVGKPKKTVEAKVEAEPVAEAAEEVPEAKTEVEEKVEEIKDQKAEAVAEEKTEEKTEAVAKKKTEEKAEAVVEEKTEEQPEAVAEEEPAAEAEQEAPMAKDEKPAESEEKEEKK
jgi:small subunit ribosomal protein S16